MSKRQLPGTYYAFTVITVAGFPVAMLANGQRVEHFWRGLAIVVFFLWRVERRGRVIWTLMVVWNAFVALAIIGTGDPGSWTSGAPLLLACAFMSIALLLSPSMRDHVGLRAIWRRDTVSRA